MIGSVYLPPGTGNTRSGTYNASFQVAGAHSLTAKYQGDASNGASTSATVVQNVQTGAAATTTTLASSLNPVSGSRAVTLTATVTGSGANPTGTVAFLDGTKLLGTQSITGGTATFSTSFSSQGTHALTAAITAIRSMPKAVVLCRKSSQLRQPRRRPSARRSIPHVVGPVSLSVTVTGNSPMGAVDLFLSDKIVASDAHQHE
jgi:hypothetical protein